jgi:hypothetical protein
VFQSEEADAIGSMPDVQYTKEHRKEIASAAHLEPPTSTWLPHQGTYPVSPIQFLAVVVSGIHYPKPQEQLGRSEHECGLVTNQHRTIGSVWDQRREIGVVDRNTVRFVQDGRSVGGALALGDWPNVVPCLGHVKRAHVEYFQKKERNYTSAEKHFQRIAKLAMARFLFQQILSMQPLQPRSKLLCGDCDASCGKNFLNFTGKVDVLDSAGPNSTRHNY